MDVDFELPEYEWMQHVEQWQEYFPCIDDNDELTPPVDDNSEYRLQTDDDIFGFLNLFPMTPPPTPTRPIPMEVTPPETSYLQNIHLFQVQSRYTFPVNTIPDFPFLK